MFEDWTGSLYCGINLEWDYMARTLDLVMPGYIKTQLQRYKHSKPTRPQHSPHPVAPRRYGKSAQHPIPPYKAPAAGPDGILCVQQVVGSILYYARAVYMIALTALTTLGSKQDKATAHILRSTEHLLDYLATYPNTKLRYYASAMVLNIQSDVSYASERGAKSRAAGHYFLGWVPRDNEPIRLNGAIYTLCNIMKFVASSAAEAELGALFMNAKEGRIIRLTLKELGHPQPPTPMHCDNKTAAGI